MPIPGDRIGMTIAAAALMFGISRADILSPSRLPKTVRARHVAMVALHVTTRLTRTRIGALFGRDHTTVLAAFLKAERDESLREDAARLIAAIEHEEIGQVAGCGRNLAQAPGPGVTITA